MEKQGLKEAANHGTVLFPLAVYKWQEEVGEQVNLHWHEETEIICFEKGTFSITLNMNAYEIKAPALLFVGAGDIHSLELEKGQEESAVVFDLNMLSFEHFDGIQYEIIQPLLKKNLQFPTILDAKQGPCFSEILRLYQKIYQSSTSYSLVGYMQIKGYFYEMLACLYEHQMLWRTDTVKEPELSNMEHMKTILRYVKQEYDNPITIEEVAKAAGLNPQYLCRYFKKVTGKTLTEYINEVRIEKAAQMLKETNEKIITVATACGYDNISYFIKRFKKQKGVTPQEYRNKMSK